MMVLHGISILPVPEEKLNYANMSHMGKVMLHLKGARGLKLIIPYPPNPNKRLQDVTAVWTDDVAGLLDSVDMIVPERKRLTLEELNENPQLRLCLLVYDGMSSTIITVSEEVIKDMAEKRQERLRSTVTHQQ